MKVSNSNNLSRHILDNFYKSMADKVIAFLKRSNTASSPTMDIDIKWEIRRNYQKIHIRRCSSHDTTIQQKQKEYYPLKNHTKLCSKPM